MGGGTPDQFAQSLEQLNAAWSQAGREGKPQTMALMYFALGDDGERAARENLGHYYAWLGEIADQIVAGTATDGDTVKQYLAGFEAAGCDEMICFPASPDVRQVELLAEAVLR
jgi:alkanesulfonate monooxygenase SsuD/methylene tetrahydromethanopterin reductase-like flavin-dependent oxidoreductase (luciferase family)